MEIGIDSVDPERLAIFWASALEYEVGDFDSDGIYLDLVPPNPAFPVVFLQRVPEPRTSKNRLHLDLYVSNPAEAVAALVALGARTVGAPRTGTDGGWWQVLTDPEGNEFCVCDAT